MFYYCAKCGNIKKVTLKGNEGVSCEVCGTPMQPVPAEYLMPNGNFFKSQDARQNFISAIQSSDTYDPETTELEPMTGTITPNHASKINFVFGYTDTTGAETEKVVTLSLTTKA